MTKFSLTLACLLVAHVYLLSAQETSPKYDHYIGVQANQLLRQIFNFGGGSAAVNNPYLITWAFNNAETGWGMNTGFGYTYDQQTTEDQFVDRTTTTNNLFIRLGFEKKSMLAPKVILSAGFDVVADLTKSETSTGDMTQPQFLFTTGTKSRGFGGGPRMTLNYMIGERVIVGTEANYYFKAFTLTNFEESPGFEASDKRKLKSFQFHVPTAIFLIVKF